jgi:hypothetical protein
LDTLLVFFNYKLRFLETFGAPRLSAFPKTVKKNAAAIVLVEWQPVLAVPERPQLSLLMFHATSALASRHHPAKEGQEPQESFPVLLLPRPKCLNSRATPCRSHSGYYAAGIPAVDDIPAILIPRKRIKIIHDN